MSTPRLTTCRSRTRSTISPASSPSYDIVVSCQNVADIYPALERLNWRPPLIEHGGLVSEALAGPKHFTSRYVGVCRSIRDAAASTHARPRGACHRNPVDGRPLRIRRGSPRRDAGGARHCATTRSWSAGSAGWTPRSASRISSTRPPSSTRASPDIRFVVVGGPDAFMPDYAEALKLRAPAQRARRRRSPSSATAPTCRRCCRRWTSSSGCRAARACRM